MNHLIVGYLHTRFQTTERVEAETEKERDRERERDRDIERERQRKRKREKERETVGDRDRGGIREIMAGQNLECV